MNFGFPIIGTDESGKGDYFGPLVVAGVYVDENIADALISLGVKDSKALSDQKVLALERNILSICRNRFEVIEINPEQYNSLRSRFERLPSQLHHLLAWAHVKVIDNIARKNPCNNALVDQFADERFINGKMKGNHHKMKVVQMHKAERHVAVAAASVMARAGFLKAMSRLSSAYGIDLPKGATDRVIGPAKIFVAMHGIDALGKVAKLHFVTTQDIIN